VQRHGVSGEQACGASGSGCTVCLFVFRDLNMMQQRACGSSRTVGGEAERCGAVADAGELRLLPQDIQSSCAGEVDGAREHSGADVHISIGRVVVWDPVLGGVLAG